MNSQALCLSFFLPLPLASVDKSDLGFYNLGYHAQPHPLIAYYFVHKKLVVQAIFHPS